MIKSAELKKMVHTVLLQRENHRREMTRIQKKFQRQKTLWEEKELSLHSTLKRYKQIMQQERYESQQELHAAKLAISVVNRVNDQLEDNNRLLCNRIKVLEKRILELESHSLVSEVLFNQEGPLKQAINAKSKYNQAKHAMQAVALRRAFAYYSPIRRKKGKQGGGVREMVDPRFKPSLRQVSSLPNL